MKREESQSKLWTARVRGEFDDVLARLPKSSMLPEHKFFLGMERRVTKAISPFVDEFQAFLASLPGKDLGSALQKKTLADEIQLMMNLLHCRCECPNCGAPSSLRFRVTGTRQEERFDFHHFKSDGRTGSCTTTTRLPMLHLLPIESPQRKSDPGPPR
jgi:hypothetical protein